MLEDDQWYGITEIADFMQVCSGTVRNWIKREGLPHGRAGKLIRVKGAEFNSWLRRHRVPREDGDE